MSQPIASPVRESGAAEDGVGRQLDALAEVSRALVWAPSLRAGLQQAAEIVAREQGAKRVVVTQLDESTNDLAIVAAYGLTQYGQRARYRVGEGVTGRVVESGRPVVVPRLSEEPLFLYRAADRGERTRGELSFVCHPVVLGRKPVGAVAVDLPFVADRDYATTVRFLGVVAGMIAQAIGALRRVEAERHRLAAENTHLREELRERYDFSNLIGNSGPMRRVYEQVARVAGTNTAVLIRGESGTGKELIAHAIHYNSARAKRPFVKVSAAALPETLIEPELFGYEKGAFAGAQARKKGRLELAEGGTLFLDEVGELSPGTQVKLLRLLQEREFERVGGTETLRTNVRLIAATNAELERGITAGTFRGDLFYRLNVFTIFVPPLRERKPDILLLADYFLEKYGHEHGKLIRRISTPAIDMLMAYHWPGNVRELENTIERAVVVCDGNVVHGHHFPPTLQTAEASGTWPSQTLAQAVASLERDLILDALKSTDGNRARAARLLGTTERIMNYKVRKHGIDPRRFRS